MLITATKGMFIMVDTVDLLSVHFQYNTQQKAEKPPLGVCILC